VKQLEGDPFAEPGDVKKGAVVTCEVLEVKESGIEVKIVGTDFTTFIKRSELARDRNDQRAERFAVGEKVDARVIQFDKKARKVQVSIKALEVAEEKEAIAQYGSSDSGATLGDILGTALKNRAGTDFTTFIKRSELARERSDQRAERFAVGEKVDARVIQFDKKARKVQVSIKALEVAEEKEAIAQYGSSDSGATLGDILGTALKQRTDK
ncbi:S1 RNA-binding domain-containing protein, partial [Bradyrhizobium sp.]|uniref:S1 RNA-binding domain-containing protein n=1 Tax=Bradyrhizobium sp. TaxID=376 RepID=UPI003C73899E